MTDASPTEEEIEAWRGHIGRSERRRQMLDAETLRRFAAALGADLDVERHAPPLAHWAYFQDAVAPEGIGPDGHPKRGGGLMPPVTLPRRMFAAASIRFPAPLILGREAQLTITVADVTRRGGRTGELVFVEVDRVLTQDGQERVGERQTIVYRGVGERQAAITPRELAPRVGEEIWRPGSVDLFRFSAATFNSHRIHYDQAYATDEEGYPGLVVHGPFTAAKLCALATRRRPDLRMSRFSFRASAPLFVGDRITLAPGAAVTDFAAFRCDGALAMSAVAEF
jgi:3-methylfumaryl-CoA hydratase